MINSFSFISPKEFIFGCGKVEILPQLINRFGKDILIVVGATSFIKSEYWNKLKHELEKNEFNYNLVSIISEPSPQGVDEIVNLYREHSIKVVVAIGGGSTLDAGKAISAMLPLKDSVKNYLEGVGTQIHNGKKIPFIAVPTTSGTGSEATKNAVLSETGENGYKKSLRHNNFVPDIAVVDPILSISCPPNQTAACGMDALSQLFEAYLSITANPFTDAIAFQGIKLILDNLEKAFIDGENIEARSALAYASYLGGLCLANAGLGTVHGFAGVIGGYFEIPHGIVCGRLMAATNDFTVKNLAKESEALKKYAAIGQYISNYKIAYLQESAKHCIEKLYSLSEFLKLPRLAEFGITDEWAEKIAKETDNKNNPVKIQPEQLFEILKLNM